MFGWRSKSSNKKIAARQQMPIADRTATGIYRSSLHESRRTDTTSTTTSHEDESKHRFRTSKRTSRPFRKFFHFVSSSPSGIRSSERSSSEHQLTNTAAVESPIDWQHILDREFQSLDIDADGYVSIADLQSVLKNFTHIPHSDRIIPRILEQLDLNHDQRISKREFTLYKNSLPTIEQPQSKSFSLEEELGVTFAAFDHNHDNYISPHEIRETMHNLGENIDDALIGEMMQTADTDHDGRISRDEFKHLLIQLSTDNKTTI